MTASPLHHHHHKLQRLSLQRSPSSQTAASFIMNTPQTQLDEGYSEADMAYTHDTDNGEDDDAQRVLQMALALPLEKRKDIIQLLIPSIPNPMKEDLKHLIDTLTHFDPVAYLPNEMVLQIFSYLSPNELLRASGVSRAWRTLTQDEKLWRACFAREGWLLDRGKMEEFEKFTGSRRAQKTTDRVDDGGASAIRSLERRGSRKRGRDEAFSEPEQGTNVLDGAWEEEDAMEGVLVTRTVSTTASPASSTRSGSLPPPSPTTFKLKPTLFQSPSPTSSSDPPNNKLSWPYLYKQRRRLESNWEHGRYKMFQLPHPAHADEGHNECVYTIQHTSTHLVSGSRDKTIRIWDLQTQRLKGEPLRGHEASVLCLQFDERQEHDIIVSGGSDSSVIIWRFSTGEIVKKIANAHDESVLNLRFDDRYIVTCSKDKTIKLWSRHALPLDSPLIPAHVLPMFQQSVGALPGAGELVAEYTMLAKLTGHHAAVNAVQIHENTIVSASGDRTIKSWDIDTGKFLKNYSGHSKGIACVQFDGRRIVSGSSDNSVRIFDADRAAEVACLTGHSNLVRTVQARFGDLQTTTAEELAEEARAADLNLARALDAGMQPARTSRHSVRNAGSSRPECMLAYGTTIPPGGGGSRWAKIVSGSYDESVILWKRDTSQEGAGKWIPRHRLHQDYLLRGSANGPRGIGGGRRRVAAPGLDANGNPLPPTAVAPPVAAGPATLAGPAAQGAQGPPTLQQVRAHQNIAQAQGLLVQAGQLLQTQNHGVQHQQGGNENDVLAAQSLLPAASQMVASALQQTAPQAQVPFPPPPPQQPAMLASGVLAPPGAQLVPPPQPIVGGGAAGGHVAGAPGVGGGNHHHHHHHPPRQGESNRVFKLQFDARRIICCSQNKVIVGWDFAAGDPELERVGEWSLETA